MEKQLKFKDGTEVTIWTDHDTESPRTWDNMGTFYMAHRRYQWGDKNFASAQELEDSIPKDAIRLPVYLYDHSGVTVSTSPFPCPWDSGQIGVIWVTRGEIRECFMVKRVTKGIIKKALDNLRSEIKTLDMCLNGEVYGFTDGDEHVGGYYGYDYLVEELTATHGELITNSN